MTEISNRYFRKKVNVDIKKLHIFGDFGTSCYPKLALIICELIVVVVCIYECVCWLKFREFFSFWHARAWNCKQVCGYFCRVVCPFVFALWEQGSRRHIGQVFGCDGGNSNDISPHYWLNRNSCNTSRILDETKICRSTYVI